METDDFRWESSFTYSKNKSTVVELAEGVTREGIQAASGTREVTENIASVKEATVGTGTAANQVLNAANELTQQAERLSGEVNAFISGIKAA